MNHVNRKQQLPSSRMPGFLRVAASIICVGAFASFAEASDEPWQDADSVDVAAINQDIVVGEPTVDIGIYYPSNLDIEFEKAVPLQLIVDEFVSAKKVLKTAGMQLNLLWVRTGPLDLEYLSIQSDQSSEQLPNDDYTNFYVQRARAPKGISNQAIDAFDSMIERTEASARTVHLVVLQSVYMSYYETPDEGRNWTQKVVRTGGLSFPGYMHGNAIPRHLRGVITLSGSRPDNWRRTAHELGHKLMNVSHEYKEQSPEHEIFADGGLMLYGDGVDIPSGESGRWHKERLHLSPFAYTTDTSGNKVWNKDYVEGGFYYDPLYGDKVVRFGGPVRAAAD